MNILHTYLWQCQQTDIPARAQLIQDLLLLLLSICCHSRSRYSRAQQKEILNGRAESRYSRAQQKQILQGTAEADTPGHSRSRYSRARQKQIFQGTAEGDIIYSRAEQKQILQGRAEEDTPGHSREQILQGRAEADTPWQSRRRYSRPEQKQILQGTAESRSYMGQVQVNDTCNSIYSMGYKSECPGWWCTITGELDYWN